jgi:hypothetical protein
MAEVPAGKPNDRTAGTAVLSYWSGRLVPRAAVRTRYHRQFATLRVDGGRPDMPM